MSKKSDEKKRIQEEQNRIDEKVKTYMGPTPGEAKAQKIEVRDASSSTELLPSDQLPDLETPKAAEDDWGEQALDPEINERANNEPDTKLDEAVDDIVAKESDEVINAEDEKRLGEAFTPQRHGFKAKLKDFFQTWWGTPKYRNATLIGTGVALLLLFVVPHSRYFLLNSVGVRASASLTVLDGGTQQPLKNVQVNIGNASGTTDNDGKVQLSKIKLGRNKLAIKKIAFASEEQVRTIGWGSNPLGDFQLTPTGAQYSFKLTDFLSQKPIAKAEVVSGQSSAFSDQEGVAVLTIEKPEQSEIKASVIAGGYRTEEAVISTDSQAAIELALAPGKKHLFVSKRSGKYDIYKIDGDGKNEELLLAGTGSENEQMVLLPHPTADIAALVSTRDNKRSANGYLQSSLVILDVKTGALKSVVTAAQVRLIGWFGDRLVYVQVVEGGSAANPKRERIFSYDYETTINKEIAAANYFNDVYASSNSVFYAVASAYQLQSSVGLFQVNPDGSSKTTVLGKEIWNIFRKDYSTLLLSVEQDWYELKIGQSSPTKLAGPPSNTQSRIYINDAKNAKSLWVDERDGKNVLLALAVATQKEDVIQSIKGLGYPLVWLSDKHVVYRFRDGKETADYIVNLEGGEPKKIKDVTAIASVENWYYY